MKIFKNIAASLQAGSPFVAYKKPNSNRIKSFFQRDNEIFFSNNFSESGFIFTPFNKKSSSILIPVDNSDFYEEVINSDIGLNDEYNFEYSEEHKKKYLDLVEKGVEMIRKNHFKKVVLSRRENLDLKEFDVLIVFKKLILTYPSAFVYLWFHPKTGMWSGATPETLLEVKGRSFATMSLAGTQGYKEGKSVVWNSKELDEQQIVTDYITTKLKEKNSNIKIKDLETFRVGNLLHLRTKITGNLNTSITDAINVLHPTPAVCGFPNGVAKEFIINNENYDRKFYTGFLGELNLLENSKRVCNLYVNLRCMEIENNRRVIIYIGSGITKDSVPVREWEETVVKSRAIKSML